MEQQYRSTRKRQTQKFKVLSYKGKTLRQKFLLSLSAFSLLILTIVGLYAWTVYHNLVRTQQQIYNNNLQKAKTVGSLQDTPFTMLLVGLGTNGEDGENNLADSINLITINPIKNYAELIPIPRDSYVPFGDGCLWGSGLYDKITHATAENAGGAECLQSTLEDLFDIDINYYISIDFRGFIQVVDALDGVDMNVPDLREGFNAYAGRSTYLNDGTQWCDFDSNRIAFAICFDTFGMQHVNGEQALALARTRHYDSDFARSMRQSELIKVIAKKIIGGAGFFAIHGLLNAIGDSVATNIPTEQFNMFLGLASILFTQNSTNPFVIRTTQLQGHSTKRNGDRISSEAYFNLVPIASIEEIRLKLANVLDRNPLPTLNVENLAFAVDESSLFRYGIPLDVGMDITNPNVVRQFHNKEKDELGL